MRPLFPVLLALAGAPAAAQDVAPALALTYVCDGGAVLQVAYLNPPEGDSYAVVAYAGQLVPMHAGPVASGVRYIAFDASGLVWHTRGNTGFLAHDDGANQVTILDGCNATGG